MGICHAVDEDSSVWRLRFERQDASTMNASSMNDFSYSRAQSEVWSEEQRLRKIREEIVEKQRKLEMVETKLSKLSHLVDDNDSDIESLQNSKYFQRLFPSLSKEELTNLLHIIMLMRSPTNSLVSASSTKTPSHPRSERLEPTGEESPSPTATGLLHITFERKPFGFQIAVPEQQDMNAHRPTLPYVFSVNQEMRETGVSSGMVLYSINGERIAPGSDLTFIQNILKCAELPCTIGFCRLDELRRHRRILRRKRKRMIAVCEDCRTHTKKRHAKRGLDGKYYCISCHKSHICEYCNFWATEVNQKLGIIFCDDCLVAEQYITFSGFPLPFSIRPNDQVARIFDIDPQDSLGLCNGWILTSINDADVTGNTANRVIAQLAAARFPLTLGFKRSNDSELSQNWDDEQMVEVGGGHLSKRPTGKPVSDSEDSII